MSNWHGVVPLCRTAFNYLGGGSHLTWVHVHYVTYESDMVWYNSLPLSFISWGCTCDLDTCTFWHMSNWHSVVRHVNHGIYMTFWHCEIAITLKTVPSKERKIFCHLCNKQHGFMLWKTCIDVITIVKFISEHSIYMNLLYMRIFTRNKLKRAIKHVCVTYFCIFTYLYNKYKDHVM